MRYREIIINGNSVKFIPLGDCKCGCGGKTSIAKRTEKRANIIKGQPNFYIRYHHNRNQCLRELSRNWKGGRMISNTGYIMVYCPNHPRASSNGYIAEHIIIAEKVLGKPLPKGAVVHHIDERRDNNVNTNLIICQDKPYHALIHYRMKAKNNCGHANWIKCVYCKQYDDPINILDSGYHKYHRECKNKYHRNWYHKITH